MAVRLATCRCGRLRVRCAGEPISVSVCHCLDCQKRSGSAFAVQARFRDTQVEVEGAFREWSSVGDSGLRTIFRFCVTCGATVAYSGDGLPGVTAVAVGAFADPGFAAPERSVFEERKHPWVAILGDGVVHLD